MAEEEKILQNSNNMQNETSQNYNIENQVNINESSNITQETNEVIEVNKFEITEILNYKDISELVGTIFFIIIIIYIFLHYKKIINKKSKNNYENNLRNKKFIDDIYIEIGETNEKTRYFIYSNKWKKRIKRQLKNIMSKNNKKIANKIFKLKGLTLNKKLESYECLLEKIKSNKGRETHNKNELWFLNHNSFYYDNEIEKLREREELINSNILFILGQAGSGKTNLATYIARLIAEKNKFFCIYMNAKDIKDANIEESFKYFFYTDIIINKDRENFIFLYLKILQLLRKKVYIIVEALNENSDKNFVYNLSMFINKYSKYTNLKFIITSRIEFFDVKYKKIIDEHLINKYKIIEMDTIRINKIMKNRMLEKYRKYYNYKGNYNERVKELIEESPILMRIFFETYRDSNKDVDDLNKYTLLLNYISNVQENTEDIDVMDILNKIINRMLELKRFDNIYINDLEVDNKKLEQLINENVLLNKSIIHSENTLEETADDVIMFTFDELRDFLISRFVVSNNNDKEILNFMKDIIENKQPIAEGVLRNIYLNYKTHENKEMCEKILELPIEPIVKDSFFHRRREENWYDSFILDMIFENSMPVFNCEIEYINRIEISRQDTWKIISDLWVNQVKGREPNFSIVRNEIEKLKLNVNNKSFLKNLYKVDYKDIYNMLKEQNAEKFALEIKEILGVLYGETSY